MEFLFRAQLGEGDRLAGLAGRARPLKTDASFFDSANGSSSAMLRSTSQVGPNASGAAWTRGLLRLGCGSRTRDAGSASVNRLSSECGGETGVSGGEIGLEPDGLAVFGDSLVCRPWPRGRGPGCGGSRSHRAEAGWPRGIRRSPAAPPPGPAGSGRGRSGPRRNRAGAGGPGGIRLSRSLRRRAAPVGNGKVEVGRCVGGGLVPLSLAGQHSVEAAP